MTDQERNAIHVVLEQCSGDRIAASEILGMSPETLKNKIHGCPSLRQRWADSKRNAPPTETQALSRPVLVSPESVPSQPVLKQDDELVEVIAKEDSRLRQGLKALKLTEDEINLSVSLRTFHNKQFAQAADLVSGGITMMAIKLLTQITELQERLDNGFDGDTALMEETMVRESLHRFIDQYIKIKDKVDEGAYKKALIELRKKENTQGPRRGKPGFAPLAAKQTNVTVNAAPGSKVEIKPDETREQKQLKQATTIES